MINNSAGSEAAQLLGNMYREARERNNVSLTTASEQLNIRSYLLNDMEKGRFGHLKLGDCLAYAKYLSVDIGVDEINKIRELLRDCDLFMSIGTSGVVYPAANFARMTHALGAYNIEFNLEKSATAGSFDRGIYGKAGTTLPEFVDSLLKTGNLDFLDR